MSSVQSMPFKALSKKIFIIALPVMIQNITEYILMFTSTAFIGRYNVIGLSAIQNVMSPFFMTLSFFIALSTGTTIVIAQFIGAGKKNQARRMAENSFFFSLLISVIYFLFWFIFGRQMLTLIGAKGEILEIGAQYLSIISFSLLVLGLGLSASSVFQGNGKTYPIMFASISKVALNVLLSWCLIFGNFGFPEFGIVGAAYAYLISELFGVFILTVWVFNLKSFVMRLSSVFKPTFKLYIKIFKIGIPAGMEFILWSMGQVFILFLLNQIDPMAAGFFGLLNILINLSVFIYLGIGSATINLVGMATGAKNHKQARRVANVCMFYALIVCIVISALLLLAPSQVLSIFIKDQDQIVKLLPLMALLSFIMFPKMINIVGGNGIRGTGDTRWMMMTQLWGTIILAVLAWAATIQLKLGLYGLIWIVLIDEVWRAAVNYARFRWMHRETQP